MSDTVRPDELSATLRSLRKAAGLSGIEAGQAAGLSQPKISRLETGKQVPTEAEVRALCRVYRAPARTRQQLLAIAHDLQEEEVSARVMLHRGAYRMQERIGRIEAAIVGTETATAIITDPRDIADYETCFATYESLAMFDADARQVFDRLSDEYRTLDR